MWSFILRRLLYSIPVYLGIIFFVMAMLRIHDPVYAYLGKNASVETIRVKRENMGLNAPLLPIGRFDASYSAKPWLKFTWERKGDAGPETTGIALYNPLESQYVQFLGRIATLDFGTQARPYYSWQYEGQNVGEKLRMAIPPTLSISIPELVITTIVSVTVGMISAYYRGRAIDRTLMFLVVLGMSISVLVFILVGHYVGTFWLKERLGHAVFASGGYFENGETWTPASWAFYCLLPVLIGVIIAIGYDTRFYRAVMVEECTRDYITTAMAKGASRPKIMFVHMLKNAMIPIITRMMITIPFLISGEFLLESYFRIPGMGNLLLTAIINKDFPVIQTFTAVLAALFILTNILTDVLYALVDPRVRLS